MSVLGTVQSHLTTALLNDRRVPVHLGHRIAGDPYGPALVMVSAAVGLTLEDVAAVLFDWVIAGGAYGDLEDDEAARRLVAEAVVNEGCFGLDEAYGVVAEVGQPLLLEYCRARAAAVFAPRGAYRRGVSR